MMKIIKKAIIYLENKEHFELTRKIGQLIIFFTLIALIIFFSLLILFQRLEIATLIYAICALSGLLILLVVSGNLEISFGDLFKIKKDTEEIKRGMDVMTKIISNVKNTQRTTIITPSAYEGPPIDIDLAETSLSSATVETPTQEEIDT